MKRKKEDMQTTTEYPSIHWQKFFNQFNEIETLQVSEWKLVHSIGYFCKLYESHYKLKYTFKFNSPAPSKSFEMVQFKKLTMNLSADPIILKEYIDWWFNTQIIKKKRRITSMASLVDANVVNEFKFKFLLPKQAGPIDRTMQLPSKFIDLAKEFDVELKTYGDLCFIKSAVDNGNTDRKYSDMLNQLIKNGLRLDDLMRVK